MRNMGVVKNIRSKLFSTWTVSESQNAPFKDLLKITKNRRENDDEKYTNNLKLKNKKIEELADLQIKIVDFENKLKEILSEKDRDYCQEMLKINTTQAYRLVDEIQNLTKLLSQDVRSLFKDSTKMELNYTAEQLKLGSFDIDLRFVNRKKELLHAWERCAENVPNGIIKHFLLVSGQMFGSGKTTFGKHLFNFQNPYIESTFKNEFKTIAAGAKDILSITLPVYIEIPTFDPKRDELESTNDLVSCSIFVSTLNQYFKIDIEDAKEFWKRNKRSVSACTSLLLSIVGRPLFFHFDEVAILSKWFEEDKDKKDAFYQFWASVVEAQKRGCFAYVSGRTPVLNFFSGKFGPVARASPLRLSLLKAEDIKHIFWYFSENKDQIKVTTIGARLKITTEEEAQHMAEWLFNLTTGVPRYVEYALREMIIQTDAANCLIDWEKHKNSIVEKLLVENTLFPRFNFENIPEAHQRNKEMELLVYLALTPNNVPYETEIFGSPLIDFVEFYGFYTEAVENEPLQFRIKIPYLWEKKKVFDNLLLLRNIFNPPIDQPKALEELVQNRIHFLASNLLKERYIFLSKKFEFLSNSAIANDHLPRLELLKMKTKALPGNRNQVFHEDVQILATQSVLVQSTPNSSLPDLVVALSKQSRYYIGWQMKNYPTSELKVSQLQKELFKFTDILPTDCRAAVFVIVVNGNVDNIVNKYRGQVISSTDTDAMKELQIQLEPHVQFIIPSKNQLNIFLGESYLQELLLQGEKIDDNGTDENK